MSDHRSHVVIMKSKYTQTSEKIKLKRGCEKAYVLTA